MDARRGTGRGDSRDDTAGRARAPHSMPLGVVTGGRWGCPQWWQKRWWQKWWWLTWRWLNRVQRRGRWRRRLATAACLPGAIRGRFDGVGAVGGAIGTPPVTTMGSRAAAQAALAAATMVAPQVLTAEMVVVPSESVVRGTNGDDGANGCDQSSHRRRSRRSRSTPPTAALAMTPLMA